MRGNDNRRLQVTITSDSDDLKQDLKQVEREIKDAGRSVVSYSSRLEIMAKATENAAKKQSKLSQAFKDANPEKQAAQIARITEKLNTMKDHYEIKIEVKEDFDKGNKFSKFFANIKAKTSKSIVEGISNIPPPSLIGAAGVVGAFLAPTIAALIGAAVVGGIGLGGIIGGIALVSKDPQIAAVAAAIGKKFAASLSESAQVFKEPVLRALGVIEAAASRTAPKIGEIFKNTVGSVDGLVKSIVRVGEKLVDAFVYASKRAGPVLAAFGRLFEGVGGAAAEAIKTLSRHSKEGASALDELTAGISNLIRVGAGLVVFGTQIKSYSDRFGGWIDKARQWVEDDSALSDHLKKFGVNLDITADGYKKGSEASELYRKGVIGLSSSVNNYDAYLERQKEATKGATTATNDLARAVMTAQSAANTALPTMDNVKNATEAVSAANEELSATLTHMGGELTVSGRSANALRTAMDNLYGASIRQTDANEAFQASFDDLSSKVRDNSKEFKRGADNLNIHSKAGRDNRDALENLLTTSNNLYLADIAAGVSVKEATRRHNDRTAAVKKEAEKVHLNNKETNTLIGTYGQIPKKKTTDVILSGIKNIVNSLKDLYIIQRALAEGIPISSARAAANEKAGPAKKYGGFAHGGFYEGKLPGAPSAVDNMRGVGPDGKTFGLAGGEYIVNPKQTKKNRQLLENINAGMDGFASGGYYPVDTSTHWKMPLTAAMTHVMSKKQAMAKVTPAATAGMGWKKMQALIGRNFPSLHMISGYRPGARTLSGNVSYHALGRAVDYPPNKALAQWIHDKYMRVTKELITPWNNLNIHNGSPHQYSGAVWNQHNFAGGNAHDHWAMDKATTVEPGEFHGYNGTGRRETLVNSDLIDNGPNVTVNATVVGTLSSAQRRQFAKDLAKDVRDEFEKLGRRNGGSIAGGTQVSWA